MNGEESIDRATRLIREADALLIGAGAGMGVDSGLPDFRGTHGFWRAYPALGRAEIPFKEIASPATFRSSPRLAWGFYGHRLALYRNTIPHDGFRLLREIGERLEHGAFVFTSNVDGQFQAAGFYDARVCECHGSLHYLQCMESCTEDSWPADALVPEVDTDLCRLTSVLPSCPHCGALARPNALMFNDMMWNSARSDAQAAALKHWLTQVKRLVVIELGAGKDVPSVRHFCEDQRRPLIRINPRESKLGNAKGVGLAMGALEALTRIAGLPEADLPAGPE